MSEDRDALASADAQIAAARDDPAARLALMERLFLGPTGRAPRHLAFRRAALSFMRWQAQRGLLNPRDASPPGSVWWRAMNERRLCSCGWSSLWGTFSLRDHCGTSPSAPPHGLRGTTGGEVTVDMKLEVIGIPVSDVDVAKAFYLDQVGFGLDHDARPGPGMRVVQMTPPGSPCSVVIGEGMPLGEPGTTKGPQLVVEDIDAARVELFSRGVPISEVQQLGPEGAPGSRFAFFSDPDGNGWSLQEIKRA